MTRTAIATLTLALTATASVAAAQTETAPAPAAAPAPAPTMAAPASPMAAPMTAPAPGAPVAAEPAPPPPPPAPPTGDALYLMQALDAVCTPLIARADQKALLKATGYKKNRDGMLLKLEGGKSILVSPPSAANPTVCRIVFNFGVDEWRPMVEALNNWSYARTPPLQLLYQGYKPIGGVTTTWSWEVNSGGVVSGLAFNLRKNADGAPAGKGGKTDIADVVFSYSAAGQ